MICAGIDAGSRAIKIVIMDAMTQQVLVTGTGDQGVCQEDLARDLYARLLQDACVKENQVKGIVATGYGRSLISFADTTITEITCHARGVAHQLPEAKTVVEIGGQDSKFLRLNGSGEVRDFVMNDRCAAGTGRFIEVVSERLNVPFKDIGALAGQSTSPAVISSTCVVFAETEIVGLLASGTRPADIMSGVLHAIASRVAAMAGRSVEDPVIFTGGVALVSGMAATLEESLGRRVHIASSPQMTGALGAALAAARLAPL